jgi:glycosyltransferase A (GT-A) superfamily protein (DUF2064 family)
VLQRGLQGAPAVIAVGSDTPELTPQHIREAVRALEQHDAVLGPSPDGGYYLIGLKRFPNGLLGNVPWSSPQTLLETEQRLRSHGLIVSTELAPLHDVDTQNCLLRLIADSPNLSRATKAFLERYKHD